MPKQGSNNENENSGVYGVAVGLTLICTLIAIFIIYRELKVDYLVW